MKLTIIYAPPIDREKLRVRINAGDKPKNIEWYDYVEVGTKKGKTIVCKLHGDAIPEIEVKDRRSSLIHINEPLRDKLGVQEGQSLEFQLKKRTGWLAWYYFVRYHPDDVVRVSTWLGIIAIVLGILSVVIVVC